ncbi:hypothetical protein [Agromyces sp. Marseille-Q5079]|uniref:hypothetical protein n=1 Tax=Agromyces sp. Marseille-Q5079 TaxID=3439059 RepID=UPI003D9C89D5
MEISDWIAAVAAAAAVGSALFAWRQARAAQRSESEAHRALDRMAAAQEALALASRKSAWGVPKKGPGSAWMIRNTSGKDITVVKIDVKPARFQGDVELERPLPAEAESGEFLQFRIDNRVAAQIESIRLTWFFTTGSGEEFASTRTLR